VDSSANRTWIHDVFDTGWNIGAIDLIHSEGMNYFGAVKGQLGRFSWGDRVEDTGLGDLSRVGGEDPIDLLPNLQFESLESNGNNCGAKIRIASTNLLEQTSR
jgi:hypothetical protein